jgi:uncharacterized membrane protein YeaQ/YmgE (transglycosylase-associated protein family)
MSSEGLIYTLLVGAVAGWLAGQIVRGGGLGLVGNIIVGVIGAFLGSWLMGVLGASFDGSVIGQVLTSAVGGAVLLYVISLIKKV